MSNVHGSLGDSDCTGGGDGEEEEGVVFVVGVDDEGSRGEVGVVCDHADDGRV